MKNFKDKVVIITGASSGIGMALAYEFSKIGAKVCIAARREERITKIKEDIINNGNDAIAVVTDVTKEEDCKRLINETIKAFGTVDILINNAGISMR